LTEPKKKNPRGRLKGGTALSNEAIKALRLQEIVGLRARNVPVPVIAQQFNTTERTIYRIIAWGEKEGLLSELKAQAMRKLGQLSIDTYEAALRADVATLQPTHIEAHKMKLSAAKDVSHGMGILQKKVETTQVTEVNSMNWYLSEKYGKQADDEEVVEGHPPIQDGYLLDEPEGEALLEQGIGERSVQEESEEDE
jgi:hypothetical protein